MGTRQLMLLLAVFLTGAFVIWGVLIGMQSYVRLYPPQEYPPLDFMHLLHVTVMFFLGIMVGGFYFATRMRTGRKPNLREIAMFLIVMVIIAAVFYLVALTTLFPYILGAYPLP